MSTVSTYGVTTKELADRNKAKSDSDDLNNLSLTRATDGRNNGVYGKYSTVIRNMNDAKELNGLIDQTNESYFNDLMES